MSKSSRTVESSISVVEEDFITFTGAKSTLLRLKNNKQSPAGLEDTVYIIIDMSIDNKIDKERIASIERVYPDSILFLKDYYEKLTNSQNLKEDHLKTLLKKTINSVISSSEKTIAIADDSGKKVVFVSQKKQVSTQFLPDTAAFLVTGYFLVSSNKGSK